MLMCCSQNNLLCDHTWLCCVHFLLRVLCSGTHDACRAVVPSDWSLALTSWLPLCRCLCSQRGFPSSVTCCSITHSVNRCVLKRSRHEICWNRHGLLSIIPNPNIMFSSAQFTSQCCFYVNQKLCSDCSCTLLLQASHVAARLCSALEVEHRSACCMYFKSLNWCVIFMFLFGRHLHAWVKMISQ